MGSSIDQLVQQSGVDELVAASGKPSVASKVGSILSRGAKGITDQLGADARVAGRAYVGAGNFLTSEADLAKEQLEAQPLSGKSLTKTVASGVFHSVDDPLKVLGKALRYPFTRSEDDKIGLEEGLRAMVQAESFPAAGAASKLLEPIGEVVASRAASAFGDSRIAAAVGRYIGKIPSHAAGGAVFMAGQDPTHPVAGAVTGAVVGPVLGTPIDVLVAGGGAAFRAAARVVNPREATAPVTEPDAAAARAHPRFGEFSQKLSDAAAREDIAYRLTVDNKGPTGAPLTPAAADVLHQMHQRARSDFARTMVEAKVAMGSDAAQVLRDDVRGRPVERPSEPVGSSMQEAAKSDFLPPSVDSEPRSGAEAPPVQAAPEPTPEVKPAESATTLVKAADLAASDEYRRGTPAQKLAMREKQLAAIEQEQSALSEEWPNADPEYRSEIEKRWDELSEEETAHVDAIGEEGLDDEPPVTDHGTVYDSDEDVVPAKEKKSYDFSSTQLNLPDETARAIVKLGQKIPDSEIAEGGRAEIGTAEHPHVTVKYGLHGNDPEAVRKLLANQAPITVKFGKTSIFPNGESNSGDVVKVDVESPELRELNKKISALPNSDVHPEYKPHATVAYVKPGLGEKYAGDASLEGHEATIDRITFSGKDGNIVDIPFGRARVPDPREGHASQSSPVPASADDFYGMEYTTAADAKELGDPPPPPNPYKGALPTTEAGVRALAQKAILWHLYDMLGPARSEFREKGVVDITNLGDLWNEKGQLLDKPGHLPVFVKGGKKYENVRIVVGPDAATAVRTKGNTIYLSGKLLTEAIENILHIGEAEPTAPAQRVGEPPPKGIEEVDVWSIGVDPDRFQFKSGGDKKTGAGRELSDVEVWDPKAAGVISLWRDPATGKDWVADGHHRLGLAKRLRQGRTHAQWLDVKTAQEARAAAALLNIKAGRGTATDVAKFLRDSGMSIEQLKREGVSLRGELAKKGVALSNLAPEIFLKVATGKLDEGKAAAIGEMITDGALQHEALKAIEGKRLTDLEVKEVARQVRAAGAEDVETISLFGEEKERKGLYVDRARIASVIKNRLAHDKRLGTYVTRRHEELGEIGTVVDVERAKQIAEGSSQLEELFDRLSTRAGPVAQLVTDAARRVAHGEKIGLVAREIYGELAGRIESELRGATEPRREVASPVGGEEGAALGEGEEGRVADSTDEAQDNLFSSEPARTFADGIPVGRLLPLGDNTESTFAVTPEPGGKYRLTFFRDREGGAPVPRSHVGGLSAREVRSRLGRFANEYPRRPARVAEEPNEYSSEPPRVREDFSSLNDARLFDELRRTGQLAENSAHSGHIDNVRFAREAALIDEIKRRTGMKRGEVLRHAFLETPGEMPALPRDEAAINWRIEEINDLERKGKETSQGRIQYLKDSLRELYGLTARDITDYRVSGVSRISHREMGERARAGETVDAVKAITGETPEPTSRDKTQESLFAHDELPELPEKNTRREKPVDRDQGTLFSEPPTGPGAPRALAKALDEKLEPTDTPPALPVMTSMLSRAFDELKANLAPATRGDIAKISAVRLIRRLGGAARASERAEEALKQIRKHFSTFDFKTQTLDFLDAIEAGARQKDARLDAAAKIFRKLFDDRLAQIHALGEGYLESFIEDYFPHLWAKGVGDPEAVFSRMAARRPFEGTKGFLKKRTLPTTRDGVNAGLLPLSENPVDIAMARLREMDKFIAAHRYAAEQKAAGIWQFVPAMGGKAPRGFAQIKDPIGQVWSTDRRLIAESFDAEVRAKLTTVIDALGIKNYRGIKGFRGDKFGFARKEPELLATRFAGDQGVIMHELGHILDFRYGLWDKLVGAPEAKPPKAAGQARRAPRSRAEVAQEARDREQRVTIRAELRALADLRHEGLNPADISQYSKDYVRNKREQMANVLHALLYAPEKMGRVAPTVKARLVDFLKNDPKLKPLLEIEPSLRMGVDYAAVGGDKLVLQGHWYAPEPAARIINNHLSPGFRGSVLFDAYRGIGNMLNMAQLGLSAFHAGFTTLDVMVTRLDLAIDKMWSGHPIESLKTAVSLPAAPFTNFRHGYQLRKAYLSPDGVADGDLALMAQTVADAGGRVRQDSFYRNNFRKQLQLWIRLADAAGNRPTAMGRFRGTLASELAIPMNLIGSTLEFFSWPIMEQLVPIQKLGVFRDLAKWEIEKMGPDVSDQDKLVRMQQVWRTVDNRMGQVVYDNEFWNRGIKDILHAGIRSVGWNKGTFELLGGGAADIAAMPYRALKAGGKPELTLSARYMMALPMTVAMVGYVIGNLYNGWGWVPKSIKDLYYIPTGRKDENGNEERVQLPSYIRDVVAMRRHPVNTIGHKLHPLPALIADMLQNKTFFGDKIINGDDPFVKQLGQAADYMLDQAQPFGVKNLLEERKRSQSFATQAAPFVGITPAPREMIRTPAQNKMAELSGGVGTGATPEAAAKRKLRGDIRSEMGRDANHARSMGREALSKGQLTPQQVINAERQGTQPWAYTRFKMLSLDDAETVYELGNPEEKKMWLPILNDKRMRLQRAHPQ